jgi:hypothetical protein
LRRGGKKGREEKEGINLNYAEFRVIQEEACFP